MTALLHHVDVALLRASFYRLKREASPGVDGLTWRTYERGLEERLAELHARVHRGSYRALPSRRAYIDKEDGSQRPLGIAALEDKIVQQAVRTVLEQVYEVDFLGFSYGFRPGRGPHDALDALAVGLERKKVNWVLDADIRGFFDALDHAWLLKFLEHRLADRRILRLIRKWLRAGVMEDGRRQPTRQGTPQGAVISPLLANVFLHYVLDLWINQWRTKHATGDVIVVRYADDFVMGFQHKADAERCLRELRQRLQKFGLELHPEKTRLLEFGRYAAERRRKQGRGKPETFAFLGFTHYCGTTRQGRFTVKRRTLGKRLRRTLRAIQEGLRRRREDPIPAQGAWLRSVLQGWLNYHAVPHNYPQLRRFLRAVARGWRNSLLRRSHKARLPWERMYVLMERWFPRVTIVHPYPSQRFDARLKVGAG
jgi:group II intron reverse transcriptase/maturase